MLGGRVGGNAVRWGFPAAWRPALTARWLSVAATKTEHPPEISRGEYGKVTGEHVAAFRDMVPHSRGVIADGDELKAFTSDWMGKYHAAGSVVLRPNTTEQVSAIMAYCNAHRIAVVPQGGNTGLVGGSTPVFDEVVLSLGAMNQVRSFDASSGVVVADAGCVLQDLEERANEDGLAVPLDLGAKGSCQIGGNVATLAGGLRLYRYGSLRNSVLGLEVVLPDGTVIDALNTLRKDNTGYDIKQLFMGSEGTLGVITAVAVGLTPSSSSVQTALVAVADYPSLLRAQTMVKDCCNEIVSALEFFDGGSVDLVLGNLDFCTAPLAERHPFYMLVETRGSNADHDLEKLMKFLETSMAEGVVVDGVLCESGAHAAEIWKVRESITEAMVKAGAVYKYDVSLPHEHLYALVEDTNARLREHGVDALAVGFGHLGDCNLHLNVSAPGGYSDEVKKALEPFVYEWTGAKSGSISAEHGMGVLKRDHLHLSKSGTAIGLMQQLKRLIDPNSIMNPYKVLPAAN